MYFAFRFWSKGAILNFICCNIDLIDLGPLQQQQQPAEAQHDMRLLEHETYAKHTFSHVYFCLWCSLFALWTCLRDNSPTKNRVGFICFKKTKN